VRVLGLEGPHQRTGQAVNQIEHGNDAPELLQQANLSAATGSVQGGGKEKRRRKENVAYGRVSRQ
jgi:hypothetical protein